jgi:hypothetical protein
MNRLLRLVSLKKLAPKSVDACKACGSPRSWLGTFRIIKLRALWPETPLSK